MNKTVYKMPIQINLELVYTKIINIDCLTLQLTIFNIILFMN